MKEDLNDLYLERIQHGVYPCEISRSGSSSDMMNRKTLEDLCGENISRNGKRPELLSAPDRRIKMATYDALLDTSA